MGRPKKPSDYKIALENLRAKHADKIEPLFMEMYKIATADIKALMTRAESGILPMPPENKDRVNAAKVCVALLGVPRTGIEKPGDRAKAALSTDLPKPTEEELELINERLAT